MGIVMRGTIIPIEDCQYNRERPNVSGSRTVGVGWVGREEEFILLALDASIRGSLHLWASSLSTCPSSNDTLHRVCTEGSTAL